MHDFSGKTVLITGAGSGIARSVALAFGAAGARIILLGRRVTELKETATLIPGSAEAVRFMPVDITDETSVDKFFSSVNSINAAPPSSYRGLETIVRGREVLMAHGDITIQTDDHVILFVVDKRRLKDVERLFQVGLSFF